MTRVLHPSGNCRAEKTAASRVRSIFLTLSYLFLSLAASSRLYGDTRIRLEAHEETYREAELVRSRTYLVDNWIAADRSSHEIVETQEEEPAGEVVVAAVVLRFDRSMMYYLDHKKGTYSAVRLPVSLEENLSKEQYKYARMFQAVYSPVIEISESAEVKSIAGGAKVRKVEVHAVSPGLGMNVEAEIWLSQSEDFDFPLYKKAGAHMKAFDLRSKPLFDRIYSLPGTPVEQHIITTMKDTRLVQRALLQSTVEVEGNFTRYEIPGGYKMVPFDFSMFMGAVESRRREK